MHTDFQPTEQTPRDPEAQGTSPSASGRASHAVRRLISRLGTRLGFKPMGVERSRFDEATSLYNKVGLVAYGDKLLAECEANHRELSVAVFDFADLVEVRTIYGTRVAREITGIIVEKLLAIAGEHGFAARTGLAEFTVVMPAFSRGRALASVQRVMGAPTRIEYESGDSEIVLVPGFALDTSGPDIQSVEQLYREVRMSIDDFQRNEQRRLQHVQRSHERHSRPASLAPVVPTPSVAAVARVTPANVARPVARRVARMDTSPTIPMPLARPA